MSAADELRKLDAKLGAYPLKVGATDWTWQSLADLCNALPELIAVVEMASRAERKLRIEYRSSLAEDFPGEDVPEHESSAEGEALADALEALTAKLGATR